MPKKTGSPTIRDVARLAGVSVTTISRVMNEPDPPVSAETLARIHQAIADLNYVPHAAARSLSSSRSNAIGLLLPHVGWDDYFPPLLRGVEAAAVENGFDLLIASRRENGSGARPLGPHNTDGVVVFTDSLSDAELAAWVEKKFPAVLLHRTPPAGLGIPHVQYENKDGTRAMIDHLIEKHGKRRIAFLRGPDGNEDSHWRELGYRQSLEAHQIAEDPALVGFGNFNEDEARNTVEDWLRAGLDFDAIFAGDDDSAVGVMQALHAAGKRIPEDVAVVGFDDAPVARFCNPPLTTVRASIAEAGQTATQMLAELITTGKTQFMALLPTELVIRRSCGCA
jgi:DNA-binding LacI/PurR family transcriptional regulator